MGRFANPVGIRGWLRIRDGDNCALCGEPINFALKPSGQGRRGANGVSIDHIVPLVAGGTNALNNLQLAHGRCNRAKARRSTATVTKRKD
jgi:5-methylcytosine-specific restriction endonuclease McrA